MTTAWTSITSVSTTITDSIGSIAVIANSVAGPISNNYAYACYIGITGPGTTSGTSGATSDISFISSTNGNTNYLQNVLMHDYSVPSPGQYYVTVYGSVSNDAGGFITSYSATVPKVGNSHIMVFGNMIRSP